MPRVVPFAAGTAAVFDQSQAAGPTARPRHASHYAWLARAILAGGSRQSVSNAATACTSPLPNSPVPPASVGRAGELLTLREGAGCKPILRKGMPGSANNSWNSLCSTAKSLIVERTRLTSQRLFSTSHADFSTSRVFLDSARFYTSLSLKLLKKKEKTERKGAEQGTNVRPRVWATFPRIGAAAYFLIHEFRPLPRVDSWKFVDIFINTFKHLGYQTDQSMNPRVALRVVRPHRVRAGGPLE